MDASGVIVVCVVIWLIPSGICGAVAADIAEQKRRASLGFWMGFFFGPLGILIACVLPELPPVEPRHASRIELDLMEAGRRAEEERQRKEKEAYNRACAEWADQMRRWSHLFLPRIYFLYLALLAIVGSCAWLLAKWLTR